MTKLTVIVGLGISGLSCVRYLYQQGIPVAVNDTRPSPPNLDAIIAIDPTIPISLGKLDEALLSKADQIILSPGIPIANPIISKMIKQGVRVIGDIELFAQAATAPVIAITGTNAKSTVTTLVGKMAEAAGLNVGVGGNLGMAALDLLSNDRDLYVLELSSFQLETTEHLKAKVATVLNVTPDHMDRYPTIRDYQLAKLQIYKDCEYAVVNKDDLLTEPENKTSKKIYFTMQQPAENEFGFLDNYLMHGKTKLLHASELPVAGKHYQANALASLALGHAYGLPMDAMLKVLREFQGLPHRCQLIRETNQVKWYNDSKGTNVGASLAAIEGLGAIINGKLILIAGGIGKNADFSPLLPAMQKYARHVVLIGDAAKELACVIGNSIPYSFATSMEEAIKTAAKCAQPQDSVLLSPACASFDMFKNFEHRGEVFTELVKGL